MTARVLPFVNVERLVLRYLNATLTAPYKAVTDIPTPLDAARLPLVVVLASTASKDGEVTAYPRVDIYNMAATRQAMWDLTAATNEAMRLLSGAEVDGQLIDRVDLVMRPYFLAWSPTVPRSIGTYEIQLRPRQA